MSSISSTLADLSPSGVVEYEFSGIIRAEPGSEIEAAALKGKITTTQIEEGAITTPLLAANSVVAGKIGAGQIITEKLAVGSVTGEKIAAGTITAGKISVASLSAISANAGTLTAGTLIGTTIATATEGTLPRLVIDSAGLRGYNAAGTQKLRFETATGILFCTGVLSAETGSEIPTKYLSGQIKETQIENGAISTPLLAANSVTAEKIVAGTITGAKVAAGTITAEKLSVATLSAISANLGSITAGTITGATFRTSGEKETVLDSTGLWLISDSVAAPATSRKIRWLKEAGGAELGRLYVVYSAENQQSFLSLGAISPEGRRTVISGSSSDKAGVKAGIKIEVEGKAGAVAATIMDELGASTFVQIAGAAANLQIATGSSEVTYPGAAEASNVKEVTHGLGATPKQVLVSVTGGASGFNSWIRSTEKAETKFKVQCHNPGKPGAGSTVTFDWIATR